MTITDIEEFYKMLEVCVLIKTNLWERVELFKEGDSNILIKTCEQNNFSPENLSKVIRLKEGVFLCSWLLVIFSIEHMDSIWIKLNIKSNNPIIP